MGTNYYGNRKVSTEEKNEIAVLILKGELILTKSKLEELTDKIHIGKQSAGWKFLFDKNNQEWSSFEEYKNWINQFEIYSEYEEKISHEEFWQRIESRQSFKDTGDEHGEMIDGYNFSKYTDFS